MKLTPNNLHAFVEGVIVTLDHRLEIEEDKELEWEISASKSGGGMVDFTYVTGMDEDADEKEHAVETLNIYETDTPAKIVRDIEDIMERIHRNEIRGIGRAAAWNPIKTDEFTLRVIDDIMFRAASHD